MGGKDVQHCGKCGRLLWNWVEICPWCRANQSEWVDGEKVETKGDKVK